jgi:cell wall-associated NlpC family hydrolase
LDYNSRTIEYGFIERERTYVAPAAANPRDAQLLYVDSIRQWVETAEKPIPYVWGGSSFTNAPKGSGPHAGCDCSSLIMRAAQLFSIPYFYKQSSLVQRLDDVPVGDMPEPGDILWMPGHVMVVGDVKNNTVIEASGYNSGYGNVHELPLEQRFHGIRTYEDLDDLRARGGALILLPFQASGKMRNV